MNSDLVFAWQAFHANGTCDSGVVAPPILRSWQRCAAGGVAPYAHFDLPASPRTTNPHHDSLLAFVRPSMEDLYQFMEGSGFVVLLADAQLTLVELIGDAGVAAQVHAAGLGAGSVWREDQIGTAALNLALYDAQPVQTGGAEHFCAALHPFACSAAPLFDADGQAIGVLGVLGLASSAHAHTLGMVIAAAQALHVQARNNVLLGETNDNLSELNAAIEAMSEGLVILDGAGQIKKINSRAGQLLGLAHRSAAGHLLADLLVVVPDDLCEALEQRAEIVDRELIFVGRKGTTTALCSLRPVWNRNRRYLGGLLTLRSPETVQRLVQRVVGAQARFSFADIPGESAGIQHALREARVASGTQQPVLLIGEGGVGKELFAHAIHNASARANGPFVVLNCAAVPRALLLGELLGYEGSQRNERAEGRPGRLELANGGTLLLQEIGELSFEAQTVLLRAVESNGLVRIGGRRAVPLDVRVIATSIRPLHDAVSEGRFRAELFVRLGMQAIAIPPLRERGDDVLLILDRMLNSMNQRLGKQTLLAPDALATLLAYPWPGNVRELETTLEQLLHEAEKSVITVADLLPALRDAVAAPQASLHEHHAASEREAILRAGRDTSGHLGRAAEQLGISRATLWRKMKQYGLTKHHFWVQ